MSLATAAEAPPQALQRFPYATDGGIAARAAIGLLVLATDQTIEQEWRQIFTLPGVGLYQSRLLNDASITRETLLAMAERIAPAARLILPNLKPEVIAFGCTSAAMAIGEERVFEIIREAWPEARCTTPITAAFAAFHALGAQRIALLTPYGAAINESLRAYIEARGFAVPVLGSFEQEDDTLVARIDGESIRQAALALGRRPEVDLVFVSCTSLRLVAAAAGLEAELGKPVTSSNHAMAWHALRLAGVEDRLPAFGRLFAEA